MKSYLIGVSMLLLSCFSQRPDSYSYNYSLKDLQKPLGTFSKASGEQVASAFQSFLKPFELDLSFSYNRGKLHVTGAEKSLRAFEYISQTMIKDNLEIHLSGNLQTALSGENLSFDVKCKPFETKTIKFMTNDDNVAKFTLNSDLFKFRDQLILRFNYNETAGYVSDNHAFSLYYTENFLNGEESPHYVKNKEVATGLAADFKNNLKVSWRYKGCYFLKQLENSFSLSEKKEIAVMPIFNWGQVFDITGNLREYLSSLGLDLKEEDVIIKSSHRSNLLLYSSPENCQKFRDIFAPLCGFVQSTVEVRGSVEHQDKTLTSFSLPVTMGNPSDFYISFDDNADIFENYSINFSHSMDMQETPIKLAVDFKLDLDDLNEDKPFELKVLKKLQKDFIPKKPVVLPLGNKYQLRLEVLPQNR